MIAARRSITDLVPTSAYKSLFNTIYLSGITAGSEESPFDNADYSFNDVLGKVTWRPDDKSLFFISGYTSNDDLNIQYSTADQTGNYVYDYSDVSGWGNKGLGAGWDYQWNDRTRHKLNVGVSSYTSNLFAIDTLKDLRYNDFERQFRQDYNKLSDLSIRYETEVTAGKGSYFLGGNYNRILIERGGEGLENILADTLSASISTIFLEKKYLDANWNANAGLRLNHYSKTNQVYPEWRALVSYSSSNRLLFKSSITRSYQFVHRVREQSLYQNQPDTWLLSDGNRLPVLSCDQAVLGAKGEWKGVNWDFEAYGKLYSGIAIDNSAWKSFVLSREVFFEGDAYAFGFDFMLNKVVGQHNVSLSYSLSKTKYRIDNLDQEENVSPRYDQLHEVKCYYEFSWKSFDASLIWVYGSGRPFTPFYGYYSVVNVGGNSTAIPIYGAINGTRLPAYHRLDLSVGYTLALERITWSLRGGVYNLYDRTNIRDVQYLSFPSDDGGTTIEKRNITMIGRVPSIQLTIAF
jgi:outer membrane receptor for ferrienterochelin and colicin